MFQPDILTNPFLPQLKAPLLVFGTSDTQPGFFLCDHPRTFVSYLARNFSNIA